MTKQHDMTVNGPKAAAEVLLSGLQEVRRALYKLEAQGITEMLAVTNRYNKLVDPLRDQRAGLEKELMALMKKNKGILFDGADVVNLPPGSLIRNLADHVSIPKTALAECEAQGFDEVIKIVKSLDRDAIEKWPDARLVLIGAERKSKEEFKYNLKVMENEA